MRVRKATAPRSGRRSRSAARAISVPATRAARGFSDLLNRVEYRGESFVIERNGEAVCEVAPVRPGPSTLGDLFALLKDLPRVDADYLDDLENRMNNQPPLPPSPWES